MQEITIVTAFFDINRKNFKNFPRTNEEYLNYFKVWSRMNNKLIVYTYHEMAEKVADIRSDFGLKDKTIIIEIEDYTAIENDIYNKMKNISNNDYFINTRLINNAVSNGYTYDYIMLLKYYFLYDAVNKGYADGIVAWMDFGFNHGDKCYTVPEEFSFSWNTELSKDKIHLFSLKKINKEIPIFVHVLRLDDSMMGCPIILDSSKCAELWDLIKKQMESLIRVGFIDDDQLLLLMAYYDSPKIFEIHISDWFMPLKENGGKHLTIREKPVIKNKRNFFKKILYKLNSFRKRYRYIKRISFLYK